jgi:telomere length regulation protein
MSDFLTALSTVSLRPRTNSDTSVVVVETKSKAVPNSPTSTDQVLQILQSHPDETAITRLLLFLNQPSQQSAGFDIKTPTPSSAKVVNELVNTTLPDYWGSNDSIHQLLLGCLRSIAGIGAVLGKLRLLTASLSSTPNPSSPLSHLISILSQLLNTDALAKDVYADISRLVDSQPKRTIMWKEFLSLICTAKIVASTAEAEHRIKSLGHEHTQSWLSDGSKYSAWLARNICTMIQHHTADHVGASKPVAQLCGKALGIGYPGRSNSPSALPRLLSLSQLESSMKYTRALHLLRHMQFHPYNPCLMPYNPTNKNSS